MSKGKQKVKKKNTPMEVDKSSASKKSSLLQMFLWKVLWKRHPVGNPALIQGRLRSTCAANFSGTVFLRPRTKLSWLTVRMLSAAFDV